MRRSAALIGSSSTGRLYDRASSTAWSAARCNAASRRSRYPAASIDTSFLSCCPRNAMRAARCWSASIVDPCLPINSPRSSPFTVAAISSSVSTTSTDARSPSDCATRNSIARIRSAGSSGSSSASSASHNDSSTRALTRAGRPASSSPASSTSNSTSSASIPGNDGSSALIALHFAAPTESPSPSATAEPPSFSSPAIARHCALSATAGGLRPAQRRRPERFFFLRGEGGGALGGPPSPPPLLPPPDFALALADPPFAAFDPLERADFVPPPPADAVFAPPEFPFAATFVVVLPPPEPPPPPSLATAAAWVKRPNNPFGGGSSPDPAFTAAGSGGGRNFLTKSCCPIVQRFVVIQYTSSPASKLMTTGTKMNGKMNSSRFWFLSWTLKELT